MKSTQYLNKSQTALVKQSWPMITSNNFWTTFYINLFKRNPLYQLQFDRFANVPFEELESNVHFLAHSFRTGFAFNTAIEHLEKPDELHRILMDLGEKHRKFRLTAEHFEAVKDILLCMIEDRIVLTDVPARNILLVEAWKPCITLVIGVIMDSATVTVN
ncbi:neuroglobin-like [Melanaphis sacchari]|nr:neuroglobin-like [Melanaphis sacchari]